MIHPCLVILLAIPNNLIHILKNTTIKGEKTMTTTEFDILVNKAIENAPTWIKEDVENIINKSEGVLRLSYVISELYSRYTFSFKHITSSMNNSSEWSLISFERLNFIDNNLDLIQYIVEKIKKSK